MLLIIFDNMIVSFSLFFGSSSWKMFDYVFAT